MTSRRRNSQKQVKTLLECTSEEVSIAEFVVNRLLLELKLKGKVHLHNMMRRVQVDLELGVDGFTGEKIVQHCLTVNEIVGIVSLLVKHIHLHSLPVDITMPVKAGSLTHFVLCQRGKCPCRECQDR
jgi:hypothetical protein